MKDQAEALAETVDRVVAQWVVRSVERVLAAAGRARDGAVMTAAASAAEEARTEVSSRLRQLLDLDVDEQRTTPLSILRDAVRYPTEVLRAAGAPPVERDDFDRRAFPDDDYGLSPASFADVDPALVEPAIAWGAAKAWRHKERHGP